ncbi:MAG: flagellar basal-body rod protein FlgF [Spirochaetota bacterium]
MVRGTYTAASGMAAQEHRFNAIANNLANADTHGYKRDLAVQKAFPQLLLRRMSDDGVLRVPYRDQGIGSVDKAPVIGVLGTGVEENEVFTVFEQGSLEQTENSFDLALQGEGFFVVRTPGGERYTRNGSFLIGPEGLLVTKQGYPVLGENGPIRIKLNNFVVDENGRIFENDSFGDDPERLISVRENEWQNTEEVDRLRIVDVRETRYLRKQGDSLWRSTRESGDAETIYGDSRPKVRQGFLETANVNPVTEMVQMIEVNRAYEANQKVIQSQDDSTSRLINQALRI